MVTPEEAYAELNDNAKEAIMIVYDLYPDSPWKEIQELFPDRDEQFLDLLESTYGVRNKAGLSRGDLLVSFHEANKAAKERLLSLNPGFEPYL